MKNLIFILSAILSGCIHYTVNDGIESYNHGYLTESEEQFISVLKSNPNDTTSQIYLADIWLARDRFNAQRIQKALDIDRIVGKIPVDTFKANYTTYYDRLRKSQPNWFINHRDSAVTTCRQLIEKNIVNSHLFSTMAKCYHFSFVSDSASKDDSALYYCKKATTTHPIYSEAFDLLFSLALKTNDSASILASLLGKDIKVQHSEKDLEFLNWMLTCLPEGACVVFPNYKQFLFFEAFRKTNGIRSDVKLLTIDFFKYDWYLRELAGTMQSVDIDSIKHLISQDSIAGVFALFADYSDKIKFCIPLHMYGLVPGQTRQFLECCGPFYQLNTNLTALTFNIPKIIETIHKINPDPYTKCQDPKRLHLRRVGTMTALTEPEDYILNMVMSTAHAAQRNNQPNLTRELVEWAYSFNNATVKDDYYKTLLTEIDRRATSPDGN